MIGSDRWISVVFTKKEKYINVAGFLEILNYARTVAT